MKAFLRQLARKALTFFFGRKQLIELLTNADESALLNFKHAGYLHDIGWVHSFATNQIIDKENSPLPWITYPFIAFIETRLNKQQQLFEYGSGNSTLYYSKRVGSVTAVENDIFWYNKIENTMPENVTLFYSDLIEGGDYCRYIKQTNRVYDMVIVDGRDRVNCCRQSVNSLKTEGVLILDDSERKEYTEAVDFLINSGFKKLDFWGLAPAVSYLKCTTVFYRPDNCLGI